MKTPMQQISEKFMELSEQQFYAWLWINRTELLLDEEEMISNTYLKGYDKGRLITQHQLKLHHDN